MGIAVKKSKAIASVIVFIFIFVNFSTTTASAADDGVCSVEEFGGGNGSSGNPFTVANYLDFVEVADCGSENYSFIQTADIELVGDWQNHDNFIGSYNGDSYEISGIHIDGADGFGVANGLFPNIVFSTFSNMQLSGEIVNANSSSGLLAGTAASSVFRDISIATDISVDPARPSRVNQIGGLAGYVYQDTLIENVSVNELVPGSSTIEGDGVVGGLVGDSSNSDVTEVQTDIDVYARENESEDGNMCTAGGIIGGAFIGGNPIVNVGLHDSHASGNVDCAEGSDVGGVIGYSMVEVEDSSATGNVSGVQNAGGLIGTASGDIKRSFATGEVQVTYTAAGGLIGYVIPSSGTSISITKSYATGSVTGPSFIAGLVGGMYSDNAGIDISDCFSLTSLTLTGNFADGAGLFGSAISQNTTSVSISHSYFGGDFLQGTFDGVVAMQPSPDLTVSLEEVFWTKDSSGIVSAFSNKANAKQKTLFKRYKTFENWNLDSTWKLDRDYLDGYLSLRGIGTSQDVVDPTPECAKVSLAPVLFKKNSVKFTNATRETMRQNASKFVNSYCSILKIYGYASKDEPKKKQNKLALQRATAVANFMKGQLEQNWVYLIVTPISKGVIVKGSLSKNRKASSTISN